MSNTHSTPNPEYVDFDDLPAPKSRTFINVHFEPSITAEHRSRIESSLKSDSLEICQVNFGSTFDRSLLETHKIYELLISAPVAFEKNAIESYCKVIEFCTPDFVYSDYRLLQESDSLIALPAWSPIRLESIDYLGPCILFSAESLEISEEELLEPKLRELVLSRLTSQDRTGLRVPESTYVCLSEWRNKISSIKDFGDASCDVSIIIPTRGREVDENNSLVENCLKNLFSETVTKVTYQVVVVLDMNYSNVVVDRLKKNCPDHIDLEFVLFDEEFNFSKKCNLGVGHSKFDFLLFLNDDTEGITSEKLQRLVKVSRRQNVGATGAQLQFSDGSIQHAGISLLDVKPRHAYLDQFPGLATLGDLLVSHETSAVTGACLMIEKSKLESIGQWDEKFSNSYNDVDLCLRLNGSGLVSVIVNDVTLTHHESVSRDPSFDIAAFTELKTIWSSALGNERFLRNQNSKILRKSILGAQAIKRENHEGKPFGYVLHLLRTHGVKSTIKKLEDGRKVRKSKLLMREVHRYL